MTNTETGTLVLRDQAGSYYLVPLETLEQGRVPADQKAQIEQRIAEQRDVQGHMLHALLTPLAIIVTGAVLIGRELNKGIEAVGGVTPPPQETPPVNVPIRWPVR